MTITASNGESPFAMDVDGCLSAKPHAPLVIRPLDRVSVRISVETKWIHPKLHIELIDAASGEPLCDVLVKQQKEARQTQKEERAEERLRAREEARKGTPLYGHDAAAAA